MPCGSLSLTPAGVRLVCGRMMTNMFKTQLLHMVPMIVMGAIIGQVFSGFITIKVPFPLTLGFKSMLQRGMAISTLESSW